MKSYTNYIIELIRWVMIIPFDKMLSLLN